jgi:hypothetical protein
LQSTLDDQIQAIDDKILLHLKKIRNLRIKAIYFDYTLTYKAAWYKLFPYLEEYYKKPGCDYQVIKNNLLDNNLVKHALFLNQ